MKLRSNGFASCESSAFVIWSSKLLISDKAKKSHNMVAASLQDSRGALSFTEDLLQTATIPLKTLQPLAASHKSSRPMTGLESPAKECEVVKLLKPRSSSSLRLNLKTSSICLTLPKKLTFGSSTKVAHAITSPNLGECKEPAFEFDSYQT